VSTDSQTSTARSILAVNSAGSTTCPKESWSPHASRTGIFVTLFVFNKKQLINAKSK